APVVPARQTGAHVGYGGAQGAGRLHRPEGAVLVQLGDAEGGHEPVAVALADGGAPLAEHPADRLAVLVHHLAGDERAQARAERGRPDHAAVDSGEELVLPGGRRGAGELGAAMRADLVRAPDGPLTSRTRRHKTEYMDDPRAGTSAGRHQAVPSYNL